MCCAIAALLIAIAATWRRWFRMATGSRLSARWTALVMAAVLATIAGSALAAQHLSHYTTRAEANGRTMLAEFLAEPICSGRSR